MKRDMDKVRAILLAIEEQDAPYMLMMNPPLLGGVEDAQEMVEYILMLTSGGLLDSGQRSVYRLSWAGREFLDSVRDPEIWRKTKEGATEVGSWGLKLLGDIAAGYIRAKATSLGLPI